MIKFGEFVVFLAELLFGVIKVVTDGVKQIHNINKTMRMMDPVVDREIRKLKNKQTKNKPNKPIITRESK